jgi:hypothetical protein
MKDPIGGTEGVDFVVRKHRAVDALLELIDDTKGKLPRWLAGRLKLQWENRSDLNGEITEDSEKGSYVDYVPDGYDGLHYGIEGISWDALRNQRGNEDAPYIYLYRDVPERRDRRSSEWMRKTTARTSAARATLRRKKYSVLEDEYYLVKRYVPGVLSLSQIAQDVDAALDEVTKALLRTIKDTPKLLVHR